MICRCQESGAKAQGKHGLFHAGLSDYLSPIQHHFSSLLPDPPPTLPLERLLCYSELWVFFLYPICPCKPLKNKDCVAQDTHLQHGRCLSFAELR